MKSMVISIAIVLTITAGAPAAAPAPSIPVPDRYPAIAADLAAKLSDARVRAPGGEEVAVAEVLDPTRIEKSLATIDAAAAWPTAWLVVQDLGRPWDLVVRIALDADGNIEKPATMFASPRHDWDHSAFEEAYREALGGKPPREKSRNLVVQTFTKKTVTSYVYDLPATGAGAKGLLSLLPEGSIVRESRAIRWSDGRLLTVALVLVRPRFLPSTCSGGAVDCRGHADTGGVIAYLAGESKLEASVDLTDRFRDGEGVDPIVPRYACEPGDADPAMAEVAPAKRFADRMLVRLLESSRPDDGRDEMLVRVAGCESGKGRREAALLRIVPGADGKGVALLLDGS